MKLSTLSLFRFTFAIVFLVALVSASAVRRDGQKPSPSKSMPAPTAHPKKHKCSSGPLECCQSVVPVNSTTAVKVLNALQITVDPTDTYDVGLSCVSVETLKRKNLDCNVKANASLVCCENDKHKGVIDLNCTAPITF